MKARVRSKQIDGTYHFEPANDLLTVRALAVDAVTECGLCPGWSFTGTVAEGQQAFREHALEAHPRRVDRGQGARRKAARETTRTVV